MITLENVSITMKNFTLKDICFTVPTNSWGVIMGNSGCGKTTILESVCGLRKIKSGRIILRNQDATDWLPLERNIGYIPQDTALFPTMTVYENIAFPLGIRKWKKEAITARVNELADILGINSLLTRHPGNLSGGEKQLCAIGRALSFNPSILCLDEPLSSLDEDKKEEMFIVLEKIKKNINVTTLHITHSRSEADRLGDIILILKDGKINAEQ
jgi:ABC-type sugar transport system ATPase subunit